MVLEIHDAKFLVSSLHQEAKWYDIMRSNTSGYSVELTSFFQLKVE
jgi:hypothetical protein